MRKNSVKVFVLAFATLMVVSCATSLTQAQTQKNSYPAMAPVSEYMMPQSAEIALARSAAPKSISDGAAVMVLGHDGYTTAV